MFSQSVAYLVGVFKISGPYGVGVMRKISTTLGFFFCFRRLTKVPQGRAPVVPWLFTPVFCRVRIDVNAFTHLNLTIYHSVMSLRDETYLQPIPTKSCPCTKCRCQRKWYHKVVSHTIRFLFSPNQAASNDCIPLSLRKKMFRRRTEQFYN